jgi:putative tricarboxylic transport membrane protein
MDGFAGLAQGFAVLAAPLNAQGCLIGLLIGVGAILLPGISAAPLVVLLIPFTYGLPDIMAMLMLVSAAIGAIYGRSLAALYSTGLEQTAQTRTMVLSCTARALCAGALIAAIVAVLLAPLDLPLLLGPAELVSITLFILLAGAAFAHGSLASALAMIVLGTLLSSADPDFETGESRLFHAERFASGFAYANFVLGFYVIPEVINALQGSSRVRRRLLPQGEPSAGFWRAAVFGTVAGLLGGKGVAPADSDDDQTADVVALGRELTLAQITSAMTANDIRFTASLYALMVLAVPMSVAGRFIYDGFGIHGFVAGPVVIFKQPDMFWGIFAGLIAAHGVLLAGIFTFAPLLHYLPRIDYRIAAPVTLSLCCFGVFSSNDSDLAVMLVAGIAGYLMMRAGFDRGLFAISFVLGPALEGDLRRSIQIARGEFSLYLTRPIAAAFIISAVLLLIGVRLWRYRMARRGTRMRASAAATVFEELRRRHRQSTAQHGFSPPSSTFPPP